MMISPKEIAGGVIDDIVRDNSNPYEIVSNKKVGDLSQNLRLYYADSFVEQVKAVRKKLSFLEEFSKFHNCATTYGYAGFSARKNNGIVDIKPSNTRLLQDCEALLTQEVIDKYNLNPDTLKQVKVVAHVPSGNRLIGVLDRTEKDNAHTVVILGLSNYNGKPK